MNEIPIFTKFIISFIVISITVIGVYLGLCVLKLNKKNEQLRKDRCKLIENQIECSEHHVELSTTERKLILIALVLPELKKEIKVQGLDDVYEYLKKKIKDSIDV